MAGVSLEVMSDASLRISDRCNGSDTWDTRGDGATLSGLVEGKNLRWFVPNVPFSAVELESRC